MSSRVPWAPWFGIQLISLPSSPQAAAAARDSIGAGATRWLVNVWVTTTSQPSNRSGFRLLASPKFATTLVPASSNRSTSSASGVVEVDDRRERVVVDVDQLDRVLALVVVLGDDDGHWLADEADLVGREQRPGHLGVHQAGA